MNGIKDIVLLPFMTVGLLEDPGYTVSPLLSGLSGMDQALTPHVE